MSQTKHTAYDADEFYERSRIYHRYRIPNLRSFEYNGALESSYQPPLAFPETDPDQFAVHGGSTGSINESERQKRVLEAAYYEYGSLHSKLERSGLVSRTQYEVFHARHEEPGKRLIVRLANTDVMNPLRVYRFRVYHRLDDDSDVYLVCTQHKVADAFLKRFRRGHPGWTVEYTNIDLKRMTDEGNGIVLNGTFGDIKLRPNLNSTSLSGYKVNEDQAWLDASAIGQLKTAIVQHRLEGQDINMMVTARGSIMIYGVEDVAAQLDLVGQAYETIVKKYEITPPHVLTSAPKKGEQASYKGA